MWKVSGTKLTASEGDFGVQLPVTVGGTTLTSSDTLKFTFKSDVDGTTVLEKEYTPVNNSVNLEFTESESELFPVGAYVYSLDWYQNGIFMCNLIPTGIYVVVNKA